MSEKENPYETLGAVLKDARARSGGKLQAIEDATGLTTGYVSQIEHGKTRPGLDSLRQLANYVGANVRLVELLWIRARILRVFERHPEIDSMDVAEAFTPEYLLSVSRKADAAVAAMGRRPSGDPESIAEFLRHLREAEDGE